MVIEKGKRFNRTGILDFAPHFKSTNRFQYLHYTSSHPRPALKGLVKGELARILRASSSASTYEKNSRLILSKFASRGYPQRAIRDMREAVRFRDREEFLKPRDPKQNDRPPFIYVHSDRIIRGVLNERLEPPPSLHRPMLCCKRGKNVADQLVRARLQNTEAPKPCDRTIRLARRPIFGQISAPCGTPMCLCCAMMSRRHVVYSTDNKPFRTLTVIPLVSYTWSSVDAVSRPCTWDRRPGL